jgi:hypothetical protein
MVCGVSALEHKSIDCSIWVLSRILAIPLARDGTIVETDTFSYTTVC